MSTSPLSAKQHEVLEACSAALRKSCSGGPVAKHRLRQLQRELPKLQLWKWADSIQLLDAYNLDSGSYRRGEGHNTLQLIQVGSHHQALNLSTATGHTQQTLRHVVELYCTVRVQLGADLGEVIVRPERIIDKVMEWVTPIEIDFDEHREFSRKYYVLSTDEEKLRKATTFEFLDAIARRDDLCVEVVGTTLAAGRHRLLTIEDATDLVELGQELIAATVE